MIQTNDLENLAAIVHYVDIHFQSGHDLDNPDLRTDLDTLSTDLQRVQDALGAPATLEQRVAFIVRKILQQEALLVTVREDVLAAATATQQATNDAAQRVIDKINGDTAQLAADLAAAQQALADAQAAQATLQAQVDSGIVTPEAAQEVLDILTATQAALAAIAA